MQALPDLGEGAIPDGDELVARSMARSQGELGSLEPELGGQKSEAGFIGRSFNGWGGDGDFEEIAPHPLHLIPRCAGSE